MTDESLHAAMSAPIKRDLYDEAICTADPWPLPDTHPELMPRRSESMWDRMARLWDSFWGMWL